MGKKGTAQFENIGAKNHPIFLPLNVGFTLNGFFSDNDSLLKDAVFPASKVDMSFMFSLRFEGYALARYQDNKRIHLIQLDKSK